MIKTSLKILFLLFAILSINSCQKPPEYDLKPVINQFKDNKDTTIGALRTITINIGFTDGDGDIGLEEADSLDPYHPFDIIKDENGNTDFIDSLEVFNIYTHAIDDLNSDGLMDTFKINRNEFKNNILFDFVRVDGFGDIIDTLDFSKLGPIGVDNLDAKIEPLYKQDFAQDVYEGPIDGNIVYDITSSFFLLPKGTYKILVTLVDRKLNKSNTIICDPAFVKK